MNGMNASVSGNWYTFSNLGPLTTTFTPAPTCTSSDQIALGYITSAANYDYLYLDWQIQCSSSIDSEKECMPATTPAPTTTSPPFESISYDELEEYYDSSVLTSSGVLVTTTTSTTTSTSTKTRHSTPGAYGYYTSDDDEYYEDIWPGYTNAAFVLKDVLEPKQTMALCCPSGMTADSIGYCCSIVPDYKRTYGCQAYVCHNYEYGSATATYTSRSVVVTEIYPSATATEATMMTDATAFDSDETLYKGMLYAPVITILHRKSDLEAAAAAASASASETPSNAAGRLAWASS
ncbi:hypothetical protein BDV12DRAFT_208009 [Aspergillus spectabilis]